mgnify:CR=1 FL=1
MNPWVIRSHRLAKEAEENGDLKDIVFEILEGCSRDEGIRRRMSEKFLDRLPCVLPEGEIITAGNACLTNDGAAFLALCSERYARQHRMDAHTPVLLQKYYSNLFCQDMPLQKAHQSQQMRAS